MTTVDSTTLRRLISGIDNVRDRALIALLVSSGIRVGELCQLDRKSIRFKRQKRADGTSERVGVCQVSATSSLGAGKIYFDEEAVQALEAYNATRRDRLAPLFLTNSKQRFTGDGVRHLLAVWCRKLGLPRISPFQLRRAFAERLVNCGASAVVVMSVMGYRALRSPDSYLRLSSPTVLEQYCTAIRLTREAAHGGPDQKAASL